jgi:quercetin dioxygenase-like cupin family protein
MIDEESYVLGRGDSYHFPATTPHGYTIEGDVGAKLLLVQLRAEGIAESEIKREIDASDKESSNHIHKKIKKNN